MKIIIDARLYGLENAGLGRYIINLVKELQRKDKKNDYSIILRKKYFNKLKLPKNWNKVEADFRHYSFKEQILLPQIIKKEKPDIVHFPHFNVPLFYKGNFVVTIHDMLMHEFKGKETTTLPLFLYFPKRLGYKLVFSNTVKRAKKIIVPSKWVKSQLIANCQVGKNKVDVIYEGFDTRTFGEDKVDVKKRFGLTKYFIYAGNAYPHKNIPKAIEAVLQLNEESKEKYVLAIATSRSVFAERLGDTVKKLKAESFVKLLGFVSDEELASLYKNSIALVYPSLSEGFGLQGLEAMASGTIALMSDIAVLREIYKDSVLYFNPKSASDIKEKLNMAIKMGKLERESMVRKGREFIKDFSWTKMAEETIKEYEKILTESK